MECSLASYVGNGMCCTICRQICQFVQVMAKFDTTFVGDFYKRRIFLSDFFASLLDYAAAFVGRLMANHVQMP